MKIVKPVLKAGICNFFLIFSLLNLNSFPQINKYTKRSFETTKPDLPAEYFIRCEVGNIGLYFRYPLSLGTGGVCGPYFEYPVGSGNGYVYDANFWIYFRDDDGNIRIVPSGDMQFIAENAKVSGIIKASSCDLNPPDWAFSFLDTKCEWFDKFDNYRNQKGTDIHGTILSHAWSESYRDDFILWEIKLENRGQKAINDLFIGQRMNCDLSTWGDNNGDMDFWRDDMVGFYHYRDTFLPDINDRDVYLHFMYDADSPLIAGDDTGGWKKNKESPAFIGTITTMSSATKNARFKANQPSAHVWWEGDSEPETHQEIYDYLSWGYNNPDFPYMNKPPSPHDYSYLAVWGPYAIKPGKSITIRLATGCGNAPAEYFINPDHPVSIGIEGLLNNLLYAKRMEQCPCLYISMTPVSPKLSYKPGNNTIYLEWDNSAETVLDPISGIADFEGYRLWKSRDKLNWELLLECDKVNDIGKNTGITHSYTDYSVVNGFNYFFTITAFDYGDPEAGVESLESSKNQAIIQVMPGSLPENILDKNKISVAPNPYYAYAKWNWTPNFDSPSEHRIGFFGLPAWADIFIYTLAGDYVDKIEHRNPDSGVSYWNCISRKIHDVASGVYIYVIEDKHGSKVMGKFVVIR